MVCNGSSEENENSTASVEARDQNLDKSKTTEKSLKLEEEVANKRPKSSSSCEGEKSKTNPRVRSKTEGGNDLLEKYKTRIPKLDPSKMGKKLAEKKKSKEDNNSKRKTEEETSQRMVGSGKSNNSSNATFRTESKGRFENRKVAQKKSSVPKIPRPVNTAKEQNIQNTKLRRTPKQVLVGKKPSQIPILKPIAKPSARTVSKHVFGPSKLPMKTTLEESEEKQVSITPGTSKKKTDILKITKSYKEKKVKDAMKEDFNALAPLYESELQKITQVWVNTIYCSLTMRANLVKLLFQIVPNVNKSQFQTEDERLLHCFSRTKNYTNTERENVVNFVRSIMSNREGAKEQYSYILDNEEIAERYNYEWRRISRQLAEFGEKAKQLQMEIPELQKKKDANEIAQREKIKNKQVTLAGKDEALQNLVSQLNNLKQKEATYKGNVLSQVQDYKEIKEDVMSLKAMEHEFQELKAKFLDQNETYEKKIRALEYLLEEKKRILEKEKDVKQQLQLFLANLQAQQKRLTFSVGKEQVDYVLGKTREDRDKRREQLWIAAVKLVLKGFLIQMKKLERERNKLLLELQSNDTENFITIATWLIQKENFIRSIKLQMNDIQRACKY